MPLIRAFGRWLRSQTTDASSGYSRAPGNLDDPPVASMVRSWVVILVAVLAIVPIVLVGVLYELVRTVDRARLLPERGRWIAAIALSVAIGAVMVSFLTRSA